MTATADQPAPQPAPRRDSFGVPWCDNGCPLFRMGGYCVVLNKKMHLEVCEPQARTDAAELQRLRKNDFPNYDALLAALTAAQAEVARLKAVEARAQELATPDRFPEWVHIAFDDEDFAHGFDCLAHYILTGTPGDAPEGE